MIEDDCRVGAIADIPVFCRIVCSFEMEFELVTLATQSFRTYLDEVCNFSVISVHVMLVE